MNKTEPKTFEVAPYSDVEFGPYEAFKVIKQIIADLLRDSPAHAVNVAWVGDKVRMTHQTFTTFLPIQQGTAEGESREVLKQTISYLKREFRDRTGKTPSLQGLLAV